MIIKGASVFCEDGTFQVKDVFVEEDITYIAYTGDCSCKEALKSVKFEFGK